MMICNNQYPEILAFSFLHELQQEFLMQHKSEDIQRAKRPYTFVEFGKFTLPLKLETIIWTYMHEHAILHIRALKHTHCVYKEHVRRSSDIIKGGLQQRNANKRFVYILSF